MPSSAAPQKLLDEVKGLLSKELKLCKTLRAMISRELEAIVLDGDMEELLRVLKQKDEVIAQLQLLADSWRDVLSEGGGPESRELIKGNQEPAVTNVGGRILDLFPDDREVPALLKETRELSDSILTAEDEARRELEKFADGLRAQLSSRAHGRRVAASYAKMGGSII